jgi:hypothetical protein
VTKHSDIGKRSSLLFEFVELESKNKAVDMEKKEIQKYFQKFWEAPPLNAAIPQREKWFDKLRMKPETLSEES